MNILTGNNMTIYEEIVFWLKSLKGWQTELAYRLLSQDCDDSDFDDIIEMLKKNSDFSEKEFPSFISNADTRNIRLCCIKSVKNIGNLAPRNPLQFESDKNIVVIYGLNGSGKSGYTKIIKKISGKPRAEKLRQNAFAQMNETGGCVIKYQINGVEKEINWEINDDPIIDLLTIDVFDTRTGSEYINGSNAVSYVPRSIRLFEELSLYFSKISNKLTLDKNLLVKKLDKLPFEYAETNTAKIYNNLKKDYTKQNINSLFIWTSEDEKSKITLENRLKESDPVKEAEKLRVQKVEIGKLVETIYNATCLINQESFEDIINLRNNTKNKRAVAQESANILAEKTEFSEIGSNTWKTLWEAARAFSTQEAYKGADFPQLDIDSRCVLCHQKLDDNAKIRLTSFEVFIKSKLESDATIAEKALSDKLEKLPKSISKDIIRLRVKATNITEDWLEIIEYVWKLIDQTSNAIINNVDYSDCTAIFNEVIGDLNVIKTEYESQATQFDIDAKQFDRIKANSELIELNAKKWCFGNKDQILKEIERLGLVYLYDHWISQCQTNSITRKAGGFSQSIITDEYINRFNIELKALGAHNIKVKLSKENSKGVIKHSIKLKDAVADIKPHEILSEGEYRIIALASFLADVTGENNNSPFIFDDPISSLDQTYEEQTVDRLVKLSETRQVIVLTHRLSLLGQLSEKCNGKIQIIGIRAEHWGAGEIGETQLFAKKTDKALNTLINDKLPKAKKIYESSGYEEYYSMGKMLCSDLRILIERIVEFNLLADVVSRYRRAINTAGKIEKLSKITTDDCNLINDFMTRYSRFEHSQSSEAPIELPKPEELKCDMEKLSVWLTEFNSRNS